MPGQTKQESHDEPTEGSNDPEAGHNLPVPSEQETDEGVPPYRGEEDPYGRHLMPDWEGRPLDFSTRTLSPRTLEFHQSLPEPTRVEAQLRPRWNSVALFFNLEDSSGADSYRNTTVQDALDWLDEGDNPADPPISDFMRDYWTTLSYGKLVFGVDAPRDSSGRPLIPTVKAPDKNPDDWGGVINACLDANAEAIWQAAGGLTKNGRRWIPSVVLVQKYKNAASANFGGYTRTVKGKEYEIGDTTHIEFDLKFVNLSGVPKNKVRHFWGTLCHEYAHNFLEFGDLYGPQGCTGYWDLLGCHTAPGRMSEVCSSTKERVGWIRFKHVLRGPKLSARHLPLRPYTTTGDAIKIIPDPKHNPHEYFLLEYRKSTGRETWRPDGALAEEGLLIIHINDRLHISNMYLMRDAPFFDPEFADFSDRGGALWTGHGRLNGILFPNKGNNAFTRITRPSSNFYGGRPSGLRITDIRVDRNRVRFRVEINGNTRVGWKVSGQDRCLAGQFTPESRKGGQEIFCRNEDAAAVLVHRQAQWFVVARQDGWIGDWNLGKDNYEVVGDFDGDGRDEIYIRSPEWAGILKWGSRGFYPITVQHDRIGGWNLGADNRELAADVDGDGQDEIYIRSPEWAGVLKLERGRLRLQSAQHDWIDGWNLGTDNQEYSGRFTTGDYDEILIRSPEWLGLFYWHPTQKKLRSRKIQHDWIDGWNLGEDNRQYIGDFDGDGLDEIYIRSPMWAGVIKWQNGRFRLLWIRESNIEHISDKSKLRLALQESDRSYAGRFLPKRDGILHRASSKVAVLTWEGNELRVRHQMESPFGGRWPLGNKDKFVLGDFHRLGPDIADPKVDFVRDTLTDVFIHNEWGTGMFGVDHFPDKKDIGLSWINKREILFDTYERFVTPHHVHAKTGDGKEFIVLTGVVIVDLKGESGEQWRWEIVDVAIPMGHIVPRGKGLKLENWDAFATINAVYNGGEAHDSGHAVDAFELLDTQFAHTDVIQLRAHVAVRDSDAYLYRIGYHITLKGSFG